MAVQKQLKEINTKLVLTVEDPKSTSGFKSVSRSFPRVSSSANIEDVHAAITMVAGLQKYDLEDILYIENYFLNDLV